MIPLAGPALVNRRAGACPGRQFLVGTAFVAVSDFRADLAALGDEYLHKTFTPRELSDCSSSADPHPRLAARLAAKMAAIQALRAEDAEFDMTSMEVVRHPSGWCEEVCLTGTAAALATKLGVGKLHLSLTHEGDSALAIALGESRG